MKLKEYFEAQRAYLADNPNNYWFKRKLYGWGWTPARKEGWYTIGIFVTLIILLSMRLAPHMQFSDMIWSFFVPLLFLIAALLAIGYAKGEKPHWQWGKPSTHKSENAQNNKSSNS